ncbi:PepSY-associated TM helix domain-containing protein [Nocardia donostiensis]|uniref:Peptidase n=1 Tax=Nocardia donostiensis TaxID=1538463 RepID=A0A1V2TF36_9NOCA|nr:PepSY domain-containing protein [Nocardia donostiensis]ONM48130.1 peptidase [Nocardia donostiensis]OQS13882.1 peptidase [Nocardia donostiensis]OQS20359.1 peptidase [Nocardia donostiensis]
MSTIDDAAPKQEAAPPNGQRRTGGALRALALRLHFYAGIFVGPFLLIAAVTGGLYAISPTLESFLDRDLLRVDSSGPPRPLSEQVGAAVATRPDLALVAVAPAPGDGETTRVLFADPTLGESQRHAVFVDPVTATPVGESVVYGSSGALPTRTWIDLLHRNLHLGEPGRLYAELAASWLWVVALAGLLLWVRRVRARRNRNSAGWVFLPDRSQGRVRTLNWHGAVGVWILPVLLLLSATGLTWSTYAGENVTSLRESLNWATPAVSTALPGATDTGPTPGEHHHHDGAAASVAPADAGDRIAQLDRVVVAAHAAGVTHPAEIAVPAADGTAFAVKERRMPGVYTVDSVAVDGATGTITARLPYSDWPLMAKLANWGIQFHMGLMFGLLNQLLLLASMIGLVAVIVRGYVMWWRRRPTTGAGRFAAGRPPQRGGLRRAGVVIAVPVTATAVMIGVFAPLFGLSLLGFLLVDALVGLKQRFRAAA